MKPGQLVSALLENDEQIDPKDYFLNPTPPESIEILGRRWWRRTYGGTYHTASIYVDGKHIADTDRAYGDGDMYLENAWQWLEEHGYVPKRDRANGGHTSPWRAAEELGIKLTYQAFDVKRQKDL